MGSGRKKRVHSACGLAVAAVLALVVAVPAGAQADDAASERDAVRERQGRLAEDLDVLQASDREIDTALDQLDATLATQQAALDAAHEAADEAARAVEQAEDDLAAAHRDIEVLEAAIREMAIASYVHPPTADLVQSLQAETLSDAVKQQVFLAARAQRDLNLLDLLEEAEARAEAQARALAAAAEAAKDAVAAADAELVRLEAERQRQSRFAADLAGRIDSALAEAAALADLDADLSAQIVAEQQALLARMPMAAEPDQATTTPRPSVASTPAPTTPAPVTPAPTTPSPAPGPTTPAPTTPPTTAPPSPPTTRPAPPPPSTNTPPLATVRGFTVHAGIAGDVEAMLAAAAADGFVFGGSAYRSTDRQVQLRIQNCGGNTQYNIWQKPAGQCSPPTAVPGRSMHEQGRALDLTYRGALITSRSNAGFQWLAANASRYGLFNLPSEPWHWSTNGS